MEKIKFYFSNEYNPTGGTDGWGLTETSPIAEADYYGAIKYNGNSYIVAKITEDEYNRYPALLGKFIVRDAIADMYPDGSGTIYLDQVESLVSKQLEERLNSPEIIDYIHNINDVVNSCSGVGIADMSFQHLRYSGYSVSIMHDVFQRKNETLKNCKGTFSQLQEQLESNMSFSK